MPFRIGPMEIALILFIVLIVFGAGKLPQIGGAIGRGIHEFRKAQRGDYDEADEKSPKQKGSVTTGRSIKQDKNKED